MMKYKLLAARVQDILRSDLTSLKWSEGWMALLFGITLSIYPHLTHPKDPTMIDSIMRLELWGIIFICYGGAKLFLVFDYYKWYWSRVVCTVVGLCLWSYIFAVEAIFNNFSPSDILFLMPILAEAWFMAGILQERRNAIRFTPSW